MDRKEAKRQYKDMNHPMGVFRVLNTTSGKSFVGASVNLPAALNGQQARLRFGAHPSRALQKDWNEQGPDAFQFEVLDELPAPEQPDYDPTPDLCVLEELWLDRLSPYDDRGYNTRPK